MLLTALQQHALLDALQDPALVVISRRLAALGLRLAIHCDVGPFSIPWSEVALPQIANDNLLVDDQPSPAALLDAVALGAHASVADAALPETARLSEILQGPVCFPDQGAKLRYLLRIRGDQRERSRQNPALARGADDGGHPRDHRSPIVFSQADLGEFLNVSPAEVSRWFNGKKRIPDRHLPELCRLYAISEKLLRSASSATFIDTYTGSCS